MNSLTELAAWKTLKFPDAFVFNYKESDIEFIINDHQICIFECLMKPIVCVLIPVQVSKF